MRKSLLVALHPFVIPVVAVAVLGGCAQASPPPPSISGVPSSAAASPSDSPAPSSSAVVTPVPTVTPAPAATPAASADPNAPAGQCADSALRVAITGGDAGAGSIEYAVTFTNAGSTTCVLEGAPGVSVVGDGNGTQLGVPASRSGTAGAAAVSLSPGSAASADLKVVNIGTDGGAIGSSCKVASGDGYRIYPPHSFAAVFVAMAKTPACTSSISWMTIGPVHATS